MTEEDFLKLITTKRAKPVLDRLAEIPEKDRRVFAKPAMALFKKLDRYWPDDQVKDRPKVKDAEAATVAVLSTATGSELKKMSFFPFPAKVSLEEIVRTLKPGWVQEVVEHFIEQRTFYVARFQPLWQAGLCQRPESDAIILDYYSRWGQMAAIDENALLGGDVWRFFEVEGGGEDSLANHEKYLMRGQDGWAGQLKRYAEEGKLDRQRLLDASLDALERDFGQYRAGWYSRFHVLMAPDATEMAERSDRYLGLLASSIPPTVSFALKHVAALEKKGALDPSALITALEPALQARAKGTVLAALKLLLAAAKKRPDLKTQASSKAVLALIAEDAGVQEKVLDAIEVLGVEPVAEDLAGYIELAAPSVRSRISALTGATATTAPSVEPEMSSIAAEPVIPVASAEEALALYLSVLETPRDPFDVERAVDGISRFGAELRGNETTLSPLRKRAGQICKNPGDTDIRLVLALTGRALTGGEPLDIVLRQHHDRDSGRQQVKLLSLQEAHLARNVGILKRIDAGHALPLLCLPSDNSGMVTASDLLSRLNDYRDAKIDPDPNDLAFALMRLNPEGRNVGTLPTETEADRAVAYALGADTDVGPTPKLWAAAWRSRLPETPDPRVAKLFKSPAPDCGTSVKRDLAVTLNRSHCGEYTWTNVHVSVTPENETGIQALPALFNLKVRHHFSDACGGYTFADIAWASLTRPADPEPFYRAGLLHQDTWQKLTDNPTRAYLEPFFRPGPPVGPLGAAVLAYYMACEDKSVSALATEATAARAMDGRLSAEGFTSGLKPFLMSQTLPTTRWTKALKSVADYGAGSFAKDAIVQLLDFAPAEAPRDIGGLLELCYELHLDQAAAFDNETAIACVEALEGGGKTARFKKKLLEQAPQTIPA